MRLMSVTVFNGVAIDYEENNLFISSILIDIFYVHTCRRYLFRCILKCKSFSFKRFSVRHFLQLSHYFSLENNILHVDEKTLLGTHTIQWQMSRFLGSKLLTLNGQRNSDESNSVAVFPERSLLINFTPSLFVFVALHIRYQEF